DSSSSFLVPHGQSTTFFVLANDIDPDGDALHITSHTNPAHGSLMAGAGGAYTYTAQANYVGTDSFTYVPADALGAQGQSVTVKIDVTDRLPEAWSGESYMDINGVDNDTLSYAVSDYDDNVFTFRIVSTTAHGTLSLNTSSGDYTYTPSAGFAGLDTFVFV